jgi:hypothetical protein
VGVLPPGIQSDKLEALLRENGAKTVLKSVRNVKKVLK